MSEALTCIAASLDLPAQTDKCEAMLSAGTYRSLGREGGGQEATICGRMLGYRTAAPGFIKGAWDRLKPIPAVLSHPVGIISGP